MKRALDIVISFVGLLVLSPVLLTLLLLIWLRDWHNPLYLPYRAGIGGHPFRMVKLRTMVASADRIGGSSTAANDQRITSVGRFIRRYKLDEFAQLCNVLAGNMSLVGPRPNLPNEVASYTAEEKKLLNEKPGMTDFASIVFSDEGEILSGKSDPDLAYHQLIRPWKSRLGIFYVQHQSIHADLLLIGYTLCAIVNRRAALVRVQSLLRVMGADEKLVAIAGRTLPLAPFPPPGMSQVVTCANKVTVVMTSAYRKSSSAAEAVSAASVESPETP